MKKYKWYIIGFLIFVITFVGIPIAVVKAEIWCPPGDSFVFINKVLNNNKILPKSLVNKIAGLIFNFQAVARGPCPVPNYYGSGGSGGDDPPPPDPCDPDNPTDKCNWFFWTQRKWASGTAVDYWIKCNSIPSYLDQQTVINAINSSFSTWSGQTGGKLQYNYRGCKNDFPGGWRQDSVNLVSFAPWSSIGFTKSWYSTTPATDEFGKQYLPNTESDIILDSTLPDEAQWIVASEGTPLENKYEIKNIMTHEVGHDLGLDHPNSNGSQELTMYSSSNELNVTKRQSLGTGDQDGVKCIYNRALGDHCQVGNNQ